MILKPSELTSLSALAMGEDLQRLFPPGVVQILTGLGEEVGDALVRHPGRTLTPDQLLELAWNDPLGIGPERVKFCIMRLRRKLGQHDGPGSAIEAVRGFGYRYVVPAPREGRPG